MIITITPLRVSLVGGSTDMPEFYESGESGAVVSFTINKYVYVSVNHKFDGSIRVSYSKTENVHNINSIEHDIAREALAAYGATSTEVNIVSDIPGVGTGLGSSSALAVGLVKALDCYSEEYKTGQHPKLLAHTAYLLERNLCKHNCGKQDHYAATYGGLHFYEFKPDGGVVAQRLQYLKEFGAHMSLLWTGRSRIAKDILRKQGENLKGGRFSLARELRDMAVRLRDDLVQGTTSTIPDYLQAGWEIKKKLAPGISNPWFDQKYYQAIQAGAQGGKLLGAGGGGFFLFWHPLGYGYEIARATGLALVPFTLSSEGSRVIYDNTRST